MATVACPPASQGPGRGPPKGKKRRPPPIPSDLPPPSSSPPGFAGTGWSSSGRGLTDGCCTAPQDTVPASHCQMSQLLHPVPSSVSASCQITEAGSVKPAVSLGAGRWFPASGLWTSSGSISQELVERRIPRHHSRSVESETVRLGPSTSRFHRPSSRFMPKFENHPYRLVEAIFALEQTSLCGQR